MSDKWIRTDEQLPPEGVPVDTKLDDEYGIRNKQPLVYQNNLFWHVDKSMFVYYTPTHWRLRNE